MSQTYKPPLQIPQGSSMKLQVTFLDSLGAAFDPTSPKIIVIDPNGAETTYTNLTRVSTGIYFVVVTATIHGDWVIKGSGLLPDGSPVVTPDAAQPVTPSQIP